MKNNPPKDNNNMGLSSIVGKTNDDRLIRLIARLEQIRTAVRPSDAETAMAAFTTELLQIPPPTDLLQQQQQSRQTQQPPSFIPTPVLIFNSNSRDDDDETLLMVQLEYHGAAIATILNAMDRFLRHRVWSPEFFNSATIVLIHLCVSSPTTRLCHSIYQQGGVKEIIRMMQTYRSVEYIQIIGIAALMVLGKAEIPQLSHRSSPQRLTKRLKNLPSTILLQILQAMEFHPDSSRIYTVACSTLGSLVGPGYTTSVTGNDGMADEWDETIHYLYHRILYAITYGLAILHLDDPVAQGVGNALLGSMVGQDVAQGLIVDVELNHGGGITCAAAA